LLGEEMIAAINAREIDEWLRGLGVGAVTRTRFVGGWPCFSVCQTAWLRD